VSWFDSAIAGYYRSKIESANAIEAGINTLGTSIGRAIEESRQNSIANQIGSQMANSGDYAPRAGLVSPGTNPLTGDENTITPGTDTTGTAPAKFTGGYKGLQLQTAIDSLKRQNQNTASEIGLRQAQAGYYGAHTNYINKQSDINQQRANTYQQSINQKTNPGLSIQSWSKQASDLLGKDKAPGWTRVITGGLPFQRGDVGSDGTWRPSATGSMYSYGDNPDDLATNAAPAQDIETLDQQFSKVGSGGGSAPQPQGHGGGNIPQVRTAQDYANVPSGQQYIDPNGVTRIKP
jgi:hypothetical protein